MNNERQELKRLIIETIDTTESYLERALPQVKILGKEFYEEPTAENWQDLNDLFEGLEWILETLIEIESVEDLDELIDEHNKWVDYVSIVSQLNRIIPELNGALQFKNNEAVADRLVTEIYPIMEEMHNHLQGLTK